MQWHAHTWWWLYSQQTYSQSTPRVWVEPSLPLERDVAQWLESSTSHYPCLPCEFDIRLVQDFQRNIIFSPHLHAGTCCVLGQGTSPSRAQRWESGRHMWRQKQNICNVNVTKWPFRAPKTSHLWRQESFRLPTPAAQLHSGVNEYLVEERWQCVCDKFFAKKRLRCCMLPKGVEMAHEWAGPLTKGNVCEAHRAYIYVRYIRNHHYYLCSSNFESALSMYTDSWHIC